jgi:acetolactate synthase-1/2/3 large subunit
VEWVENVTVKVSDWIAQKVVDHGIRQVFMLTGGGAMHLNQSLGTHKQLKTVFNHHEQACAIAAESYYRMTNRLAVLNVTSGPGGTNAITGVYGAFVDSIGVLVLSGQVKYETTVRSTGLALRQYGDQELDIEELVRPITKYCVMVTDPMSIRYHVEKALYLAVSGRPGPCWLDIPLNVQAAQVDPDLLVGFDPAELDEPWRRTDVPAAAAEILEKLAKAKRPVVLPGSGVRLSGQYDAFLKLIDKLGIPVAPAWTAYDVVWDEHPLYVGRPGTVGDRPGNFAVQNSDFLLILGSRLNIRQISYNWGSFAREAYKVWVDIDPLELQKPMVTPDMPVLADLKDLIPALADAAYDGPTEDHVEWLAWCKERRRRFPIVQPEYWNNQIVNPYCFTAKLFEQLDEGDVIIAANATASVVGFQAAYIKPGQRMWTNSGSATMGYDLPAAIGAASGEENRRIICIAGDGSIMLNLQELQTIIGNKLPVKIFLINNEGYVSIFQTHRNFFNGVEVGGGPKSNLTFPNFELLMKAFGFPFVRCNRHEDMADAIAQTLAVDGPAVCEMIVDENVVFAPKLSAKQHPDGRITSPPLEDLSPFLPREVFKENMIIEIIEDA